MTYDDGLGDRENIGDPKDFWKESDQMSTCPWKLGVLEEYDQIDDCYLYLCDHHQMT